MVQINGSFGVKKTKCEVELLQERLKQRKLEFLLVSRPATMNICYEINKKEIGNI
jgi:hypothetical protein